MELKEFIRTALIEIVGGVVEAATDPNVRETGAKISPRVAAGTDKGVSYVVRREDGGGTAFLVEFDLSIVVTETANSEKEGAGNLRIMSMVKLGAGGKVQEADSRTIAQHIRFSVPVRFPQTDQQPLPSPGRRGVVGMRY